LNNAWAWGQNDASQLGDTTTSNRSSPVSVVGGFTDWTLVSGGYKHSVGIRANGTAWAWGGNSERQLGDGTTSNRSSPVSVLGGFTDWVMVGAASIHSAGLRANGTIWTWGDNGTGQLGDGTITNRNSPVSVVGGFTDWITISSCIRSNLALRANGTAWAWGKNDQGQLGDGTTSTRSSPVLVLGAITNWVFVNAGGRDFPASAFSQALGITADGLLYAWGNNTDGKLGDDTTSNRSSPVSVVGGFTDWVFADGAGFHSVAIRANGTLWAWGKNNSGQLGDGTTSNRSSPVSVVGGFTDWSFVHTGPRHTIAVRANGTLWGWGHPTTVGDGTASARSSPVSVLGGFTDWTVCTAGDYFSLALRA